MPRLRRPSPALVVATVALVAACAGTGYAASTLARNSVGHAQLKRNAVTSVNVKDHTLLTRDFRRGQLPAGKGGTGATGPRGARGPRGRTGATGPAGPTAVAASALGDPPSGVGAFTAIASTTITTTAAGRLLVNGASPLASVTCPGGGGCSESFELFVDGQPLSHSTYTLSAGAGATRTSAVSVAGIKDGLAPGAHTVELRSATAGSPSAASADSAQVQALLAGG